MLNSDLKDLFPGAYPTRAPGLLRYGSRSGMLDGTVRARLARGLSTYLEDRTSLGYERFIVGLSGGVDSAVCALLARDAAPGASAGVIIDLGDNTEEVVIAEEVAGYVGIPFSFIDGRALYEAHRALVLEQRMISRVHLRSRLISSIIFQVADNCGGLVIDTTDRSEEILCLYEEGRRGHVAPIIDLYKSELYEMANQLGIRKLARSGCPDLDNDDAFGLPWLELDAALDALAREMPVDELAKVSGLEIDWLVELDSRVRMQPLRTRLCRLRSDGQQPR